MVGCVQHQVPTHQTRAVGQTIEEALVRGALKQNGCQKSVRSKDEDSRSQGDPPLVPFANHALNDPAARFKSDCSTARKDLGPVPVERRIETYPGGIVAACMRAEHSRAAQAARRALYCDMKAVWVEARALERIKNGELPIGCRWWLEEAGHR